MACFRCPVCQDNALFHIEMSIIGIQIPDRLVGVLLSGSDAGDAGASSLSLPSLVEHQHGRTTVHTDFYRGTGAAMPSCAFTTEAGSWQKKRGELPQQLSAAPWGISRSLSTGWGSKD